MRTLVIIQARMGSTRLPGKVLKQFCGKTALEHLVERVKQCTQIDEIVIATTVSQLDDPIVELANHLNLAVFRGSEEDVLSRYYGASQKFSGNTIVRITSDCPLFDPFLLDQALTLYKSGEGDVVRLGVFSGFPRGFDLEIFSFELLENAFKMAGETYQREHVTPYLYEQSYSIVELKAPKDYSTLRVTLDTDEDFEVIRHIYNDLYHGKHDFYYNEVLAYLLSHPEVVALNAEIEQKKLK